MFNTVLHQTGSDQPTFTHVLGSCPRVQSKSAGVSGPSTLSNALLIAGVFGCSHVLALDSGAQLRRYQEEVQLRNNATNPIQATTVEPTTSPSKAAAAASGALIHVAGYEVHGVTQFAESDIREVLKPFSGRTLSTADIHSAADALMRHYRQAGYMLAKVFVPPQKFTDVVRLDVEEGHLEDEGIEVEAKGERVNREALLAILDHHLHPNEPLKRRNTERALLLADDLPGTRVGSIIYPGKEVGSARLRAVTSDEPQVSGNIDFDNFNNRAMGQGRIGTTLYLNSPSGVGDQVVTRLVTSGSRSRFAYVTYLRPVGGSGLRVGTSLDHFGYDATARNFSDHISGQASDFRLYATYPVVRSRHSNLNFRVDLSRAHLTDSRLINATSPTSGVDPSTRSERTLNVLQVALSGDETHDFLPNGTTLFDVTATAGRLNIAGNQAYRSYDAAGPKTEGQFAKLHYSLKRLQHLSGPWSLFGSLEGQFASRNLDASQRFYLGGAVSQAGYPVGESGGDQGTALHLELRRDFTPSWGGSLQLGMFYVQGTVQQNKAVWNGTNNRETLKSIGVQVTQTFDNLWVLRGLIGWQAGGSSSFAQQSGFNSDERTSRYRLWVQAIRYFDLGAKK